MVSLRSADDDENRRSPPVLRTIIGFQDDHFRSPLRVTNGSPGWASACPELGAKQTQLAREQTSDSKRKDKDESKDQRDYLAFRDLKDDKDKGRDKDQGRERSR